jgi:hypothetical protein
MGADQGYQGDVSLRPASTWAENGFFLLDDWSRVRPPAYWEELIRLSPGRDIILSYHGNQRHSHFLFSYPNVFDFLIDEQDTTLISGSRLIPKRAVQDFMSWTLRDLKALVPQLRAAGANQIFILGSPGQRKDIETHAQKLLETDFARNFAASLYFDINKMIVTPPSVLRKLWASIQDALANISRETGGVFVSVPPESLDNEGYLDSRFYHDNDLSHANTDYGRLMINRTMNFIQGKQST